MQQANRKNQKQACPLRCTAMAAAIAATLSACGGSGSGSDAPAVTPSPPVAPASPMVTGTAATGAPMLGATVRVIDSMGTTRSAAAPVGADGKFTVDVGGLVPPLAVIAEGQVGESNAQYVALRVGAVTPGSTVNVNVTPFTTAVASLVADSIDPSKITEAAVLAGIKADDVARASAALRAALATTLAAAGVSDPANFDPAATPFEVGQPGQDRLLDVIKVELGADGVTLRNVTLPVTDAGLPAEAEVTLSKANLDAPPQIAPLAASISSAALAALRDAFNSCFSKAAAARTTAGECTSIFEPNYLQHGRTAVQRWLGNDDAMNDARFNLPELLYTAINPADGGIRAILRFVWVRNDGTFGTRVEVAQQPSGAPGWTLFGNGRPIELFVEPRLQRVIERNDLIGGSRVEVGLRIVVNLAGPGGNAIARALVKGPGLPANGVLLTRSSACGTDDRLTIQNKTGALTTSTGQWLAWTTNAANNFRLAYRDLPSTKAFVYPSISRNWRDSPMNDAELKQQLRMGSGYTFEVWYRDPQTKALLTPVTYFTRLSSPIPSPASLAALPWNAMSEETLTTVLDPGAAPALAATLKWSQGAGAESVHFVYGFGSKPDPTATGPLAGSTLRVNLNQPVSAMDTTATVAAAAEGRSYDYNVAGVNLAPCAIIPMPGLNESGAYRELGLISRSIAGSNKYAIWSYSTQ